MQNDTDRPKPQDVEDAYETEEQLHVDPGFVLDTNFEESHIEGVKEGREKGQGIPKRRIGS